MTGVEFVMICISLFVVTVVIIECWFNCAAIEDIIETSKRNCIGNPERILRQHGTCWDYINLDKLQCTIISRMIKSVCIYGILSVYNHLA